MHLGGRSWLDPVLALGYEWTVVTRILDTAVLLLLAVAVLLPRPDVKVKPALPNDGATRQRVAELQDVLQATPGDVPAALELAGIFMDLRHPDWALATLDGAMQAHPDDHRIHQVRSLAFADHFEPAYAFQEAERAVLLCESGSSVKCTDAERSRLEILHGALARVKHLDMRRDPNSAKEQLLQSLRQTYIPKKANKPAQP